MYTLRMWRGCFDETPTRVFSVLQLVLAGLLAGDAKQMRISRDQMLMEVARAVAKRGTCSRKQVGCVVARDGRVLVTGYNGTPAGMLHCKHEEYWGREIRNFVHVPQGIDLLPDHRYYITETDAKVKISTKNDPCSASVHAEANAIAFAARHGAKLDGAEMYTTYSPCLTCAKLIINAGVVRVVMYEMYHDPAGHELLLLAGVTPSML